MGGATCQVRHGADAFRARDAGLDRPRHPGLERAGSLRRYGRDAEVRGEVEPAGHRCAGAVNRGAATTGVTPFGGRRELGLEP